MELSLNSNLFPMLNYIFAFIFTHGASPGHRHHYFKEKAVLLGFNTL